MGINITGLGAANSDTATRNTIKNLGTAKPVASTSDEVRR